MFGRKKSNQAVIAEPPPVLTIPTAQALESRDDFGGNLVEYEAVAKTVGFQNPAVVMASLKDFLRKHHVLYYSYADVVKFLRETANRVHKQWVWQPLRACDARLIVKHRRSNGQDYSGGVWNTNGYFSPDPYLQAVPLTALAKVQTIVKEFPFQDQLAFGVSSYEVPRPDPFLCVVCPPGPQMLIIDHWDEPGFRAST